MTPTIGITLGDPGGIGPVVTRMALDALAHSQARWIVYGHPDFESWFDTCTYVKTDARAYESGHMSASNGAVALQSLDTAIADAMHHRLDALVTAPVHKAAMALCTPHFLDHTSYLQKKTQSPQVRMAFASPTLHVVLHSIHIPLNEVPDTLTPDALHHSFALATQWASSLWDKPRIAVTGLNPHAGEHGHIGTEEMTYLTPAIQKAQHAGLPISGPFAADTLFWHAHRGDWDMVIALTHDQGLIPVKLLHFDEAVNITLGLPFYRCSPDHGTAFNLIQQGLTPNALSMQRALESALRATQTT